MDNNWNPFSEPQLVDFYVLLADRTIQRETYAILAWRLRSDHAVEYLTDIGETIIPESARWFKES